ncbi:MAG: Asp23/Gls24 family envelope stress response protein [Actinomycetota bacterium]|nr:Asp23/Gls24 family envelope stress response protein [Actinomycetota bacterium]
MAEHRVADPTDEDDEAGARGSLTVHDRAVSRVAEYAAVDTDGVVRQSSGLGRMMGRDLPRVDSNVSGGRVRVKVAIATAWPRSVPAVSAAVRAEVAEQLQAYTGLIVDRVDVVVDEVVRQSSAEWPRVLQ